jgi:hypothetical protein
MKRILLLLAVAVLFALATVDVYLWLSPATLPRSASARPFAGALTPPRPTATTPTAAAPAPVATPEPVATAVRSPAVAEVKPPAAKPLTRRRVKPARANEPHPGVSSSTEKGPAPSSAVRRSFVASNTAVEGASGRAPSLPAGFEADGVARKPVPKISAQIEFDIQPKPARPGDAYAVRIYMRNEGKKSLKIREMRVGSNLNGDHSEAAMTPRITEIPPEQVALLAEIASVWKDNITVWGMDVSVRAAHGEVYKNSVAWR